MWILRSTPHPDVSKHRTFRVTAARPRIIGRSSVADFRVDVAKVSRLHCRLRASEEGALEIEDLSSTNGTFVNDERVERAALAPGDRIRVGSLEMLVEKGAMVYLPPAQPL